MNYTELQVKKYCAISSWDPRYPTGSRRRRPALTGSAWCAAAQCRAGPAQALPRSAPRARADRAADWGAVGGVRTAGRAVGTHSPPAARVAAAGRALAQGARPAAVQPSDRSIAAGAGRLLKHRSICSLCPVAIISPRS